MDVKKNRAGRLILDTVVKGNTFDEHEKQPCVGRVTGGNTICVKALRWERPVIVASQEEPFRNAVLLSQRRQWASEELGEEALFRIFSVPMSH